MARLTEQYGVVRWISDEGCHTAVAKYTTRKIHLLLLGHPVHVKVLPMSELRYCLPYRNYTLRRAKTVFRTACKHGNATKSALRFLKELP